MECDRGIEGQAFRPAEQVKGDEECEHGQAGEGAHWDYGIEHRGGNHVMAGIAGDGE